MFCLKNKKNNFHLRTLIWGPEAFSSQSTNYLLVQEIKTLFDQTLHTVSNILFLFCSKFNKFNNTQACMLDSIINWCQSFLEIAILT